MQQLVVAVVVAVVNVAAAVVVVTDVAVVVDVVVVRPEIEKRHFIILKGKKNSPQGIVGQSDYPRYNLNTRIIKVCLLSTKTTRERKNKLSGCLKSSPKPSYCFSASLTVSVVLWLLLLLAC